MSRELIDYWSSWIQLSALAVQVLGPDALIAPHEATWKAETPCGFRKDSNKGNRIKPQACLAWFTHCKSQQVFMSFNLLVWNVAERVKRLILDKKRNCCKIIPELFLHRRKAEFYFHETNASALWHIKTRASWNKLHALCVCQLRAQALHCVRTHTLHHTIQFIPAGVRCRAAQKWAVCVMHASCIISQNSNSS